MSLDFAFNSQRVKTSYEQVNICSNIEMKTLNKLNMLKIDQKQTRKSRCHSSALFFP